MFHEKHNINLICHYGNNTFLFKVYNTLGTLLYQIEDPKLVVPQKKQEAIVTNKDKEIKKEKERRFGLPKRQEKEEKIEIKDKIIKVTQLPNLQLDITLDNDQRWRSVEKIRQIRLKVGEEVIISEGFISGYVLKVVGKKISIRVRRIK